MWYLKLVHSLPVRQPRPDEFVGPFTNELEAKLHSAMHGPRDAVTVDLDTPPDPENTYTWQQHLDYLKERY